MNTFTVPEGFSLTINDDLALTGQHNDAAFYVMGAHYSIANISRDGEPLFSVECLGEMRVQVGDEKIRFTNDLFDIGIDNDTTLSRLDDDKWDNNPWFEIYDYRDEEYTGEILHDVAEAIEMIIQMAKEAE